MCNRSRNALPRCDYGPVTGFQWFQAVGIAFGLISFLLSLPANGHLWNEERKWVDRIERNAKAIDSTDEDGAKRVLGTDNDRHALFLAAARRFPMPAFSRRIAMLGSLLFLAALASLLVLPFLGFDWSSVVRIAVLVYLAALLASAPVSNKLIRVRVNRSMFAVLGAPLSFKPAIRRNNVPYRNTYLPLWFVVWIRSLKVAESADDKSTVEDIRREMYFVWERIVSDQERYYQLKRRRKRRLRWKIRRRARRVKKIQLAKRR